MKAPEHNQMLEIRCCVLWHMVLTSNFNPLKNAEMPCFGPF